MTDDTSSELSKIAKLNGDFRRNYGTLLGAFLYLRSISAARRRSWFWASLISLIFSAAMAFLGKHSFPPLVAKGANNRSLFRRKPWHGSHEHAHQTQPSFEAHR